MMVFVINAAAFAVAAFLWNRKGLANIFLGLTMAWLAVLNSGLAAAAWMGVGQ